jgi:hypothetical protein
MHSGSQLVVIGSVRGVYTLQDVGLTINYDKSHLQPTGKLTYLGLDIDLPKQQIQPTQQCIQHLIELRGSRYSDANTGIRYNTVGEISID